MQLDAYLTLDVHNGAVFSSLCMKKRKQVGFNSMAEQEKQCTLPKGWTNVKKGEECNLWRYIITYAV